MASARRRDPEKIARFREYMIRSAVKIAPLAAAIQLERATEILTEKDFVVTGTLRRSGFTGEPEVIDQPDRLAVTCTNSWPVVYGPWIEFGERNDPRYGLVRMRMKEPGFAHLAAVQTADRVDAFTAESLANAVRAFRG